jgi:ribosomal protein L37AE/L43A
MVGLPELLRRLAANQAELAGHIANRSIDDQLAKHRLAEATRQNVADLQSFVAAYSIDVRRRACAGPEEKKETRPHCQSCCAHKKTFAYNGVLHCLDCGKSLSA